MSYVQQRFKNSILYGLFMNLLGNNGGVTTIVDYLEKEFSDILLGILIRGSASGLSVAIIDTNATSQKYIQAFENLSLSRIFKKNFNKFHIETFTVKNTYVTKGILPAVEYQTINEEIMYHQLSRFDIIIIDHPSSQFLTNSKTHSLFKHRPPGTEIFMTLSQNSKSPLLKYCDELFYQTTMTHNSLLSSSTISIVNNHPYGDLYCYGRLFKDFIKKQRVKYISFDKGDLFYGEHLFFIALKEWKKTNSAYGELDYLITGIPKYNRALVGDESTEIDQKEVSEGLQLLKTALLKDSFVIVDNIDTPITNNLVDKEVFVEIIKYTQKGVLFASSLLFEKFKPLAKNQIVIEQHNDSIIDRSNESS